MSKGRSMVQPLMNKPKGVGVRRRKVDQVDL